MNGCLAISSVSAVARRRHRVSALMLSLIMLAAWSVGGMVQAQPVAGVCRDNQGNRTVPAGQRYQDLGTGEVFRCDADTGEWMSDGHQAIPRVSDAGRPAVEQPGTVAASVIPPIAHSSPVAAFPTASASSTAASSTGGGAAAVMRVVLVAALAILGVLLLFLGGLALVRAGTRLVWWIARRGSGGNLS